VQISGSKKRALPIIPHVVDQRTVRHRACRISATQFMCDILRWLSVKVTHHKEEGVVRSACRHPLGVARTSWSQMRASVCLLGPFAGAPAQLQGVAARGCVMVTDRSNQHLKD